MGNVPIQQAMLAIQQAQMAIQQGLISCHDDQYIRVEQQLHQALNVLDTAKQKASSAEWQLLEEANVSVRNAIEQLHHRQRPTNLQNG